MVNQSTVATAGYIRETPIVVWTRTYTTGCAVSFLGLLSAQIWIEIAGIANQTDPQKLNSWLK